MKFMDVECKEAKAGLFYIAQYYVPKEVIEVAVSIVDDIEDKVKSPAPIKQ